MQEEFKKTIDTELNRRASLSNKTKSELENWARQTREYYAISNDANERNNIIQSAYKKASDLIEVENLKQDVTEVVSDIDEFGKNPERKLGEPFAAGLMNILNDKVSPTYDENGELMYEMPNSDGTGVTNMQFHEIKDYVDSKKVDKDSKDAINMLINGVNEGGDFNKNKMFNNIKNNVVVKGNLESLVNDDIFGGRNFRNDFIESIMTSSYEDLGVSLTEEEIKQLDPTDDGKVSLQDAIVIFGRLMENEQQTIDYVAEYFTKFAEQNRVKPNLQDQEEAGYDPYEFA